MMVDTSLLCDGVKDLRSFTLLVRRSSEGAKTGACRRVNDHFPAAPRWKRPRSRGRGTRANKGGEGKVSPIPFLAGQEAGAL